MSKITMKQGRLCVPASPTIPYIVGDGVGAEIWHNAMPVIDKAVEVAYKKTRNLDWKEVNAGNISFEKTGEYLPEETINAFSDFKVGMKGPLTTPVGGGIRSLNVALRQKLDLYVCLRPVKWFKGLSSPVMHPEDVDMTIFRENSEDIYAGIEWMQGTDEANKFLAFLKDEMHVENIRFPETSSFGVKPVSLEGTYRLVRATIDYAIEHNRKSITLVHKGNIMKYTEGGFREWGYDVIEREYSCSVFTMRQWNSIKEIQGEDTANEAKNEALSEGKILVKDVIADAFFQNVLLKPKDYSVIATLNLNGDYISDLLAAMVGGIGISPGGNINYETGCAIFEATHGTAPALAGRDVVNPCSLLLSASMMLEYIGWNEAAKLIVGGLENLFMKGKATPDLAKFIDNGESLSTSEFCRLLKESI